MSRTRRVLLALAFALVGIQQTALAVGMPVTPVQIAQQSSSKNAGQGIDGMVKSPNLQGGNQPMLFEKYAPLDYTPLNVDPGSTAISVVSNPQQATSNTFGNMLADVEAVAILAIGTIATRSVEWGMSLDLVSAAGSAIGAVVNGLRQHFYGQMLPLALLAVGIVLVWAIAFGRIMRAVGAMAWAVLALVVGGILMNDPTGYTADVQGFTNWASQQALAGIGSVDVGGANRDATNNQGSVQNAELRTFANRAWFLWVYEPWTELEFGQVDPKVPGTNTQLGVELLDKNSGRGGNFDADFQKMPQPVKDWFNGDKGIERAGVGLIALVVALVAAILLLAIVARIVMAAIAVLMLVMGMPVVFAVAIIPGVGQLVFMKWLEHVIKNFATVVIMGIFLGLVMLLAGIMSALAVGWGWFVVAAIQLLILAWAFWNRNTFLALGHKVAHNKSAASTPPQPQSQPAIAANRHLDRAQRRVVQPLRPQRALSSGANGANALPAGAAATARAGQGVAATAAQGASNGKAMAAGTARRAAVLGTKGAWLNIAGFAAVKAGQQAVKGYHHLRYQSQAPLAHLVGGMPARPAAPHRIGGSPSLLRLTGQQIRATRTGGRLPATQPAAPAPQQQRALPRRTTPARRLPSSQQPPIIIAKGGGGPRLRQQRKRTP